jgi:hypothetical protein
VTGPQTLSASGANQSVTGRCTDEAGNVALLSSEGVNIDKIAPALGCKAQLSPPKGGLIGVSVAVDLTDEGSGAAGYVLDSVTSSDPDQSDIVDFDIGAPDTQGSLRAGEADDGPGRTYTFTYRGSDAAGNASTCDAQVQVPHDED